ncbi:MAG: hypothetical protein LBJ91_00215 [Clostridiales Family XIII bacterium]|jgi:hypothetical protein|nr:hypothetical protein [Clostridiales Family XIII bacterium]
MDKKKLRVLSAILIAALVLSLGMFLPPTTGQSDGEVYAVQNDSLLTVALKGAKTTQYQQYWKYGDHYWRPNANLPEGYEHVIITPGSIYAPYANTLRTNPVDGQPLYSYAYDSAELYVYNKGNDTWTLVSWDYLYDEDARDLAIQQSQTARAAALNALITTDAAFDLKRDQINAYYDYDVQMRSWAKYEKNTFNFYYDSKYKGMPATIKYNNDARTKDEYGKIPSQVLGGYFGDIDDYADYNTNIWTFTLGTGSKSLTLKEAAFVKLKVTPGTSEDTPTTTDTLGEAFVVLGNSGAAADFAKVPALSATAEVYSDGNYSEAPIFNDSATGTYIFPALAGQRLIFKGSGKYQDNKEKGNGDLIASDGRYFQTQWFGGYKNAYNDDLSDVNKSYKEFFGSDKDFYNFYDSYGVTGNPKNVKKILVGKSDRTVGTIKLTKSTGKISGTISGTNTADVWVEGVTGDHYSFKAEQRDIVPATFEEYSAFENNKSDVKVTRKVVDDSKPATMADYLSLFNINGLDTYTIDSVEGSDARFLEYQQADPLNNKIYNGYRAVKSVSKAEYDAAPDFLKPTNLTGEKYPIYELDENDRPTAVKAWVGPKENDYRYYLYNWVQTTKEYYEALPVATAAGFSIPLELTTTVVDKNTANGYTYGEQKYYTTNYSQIDVNTYNSIKVKDGYYTTTYGSDYYQYNFEFRGFPTYAQASEEQYLAFKSSYTRNNKYNGDAVYAYDGVGPTQTSYAPTPTAIAGNAIMVDQTLTGHTEISASEFVALNADKDAADFWDIEAKWGKYYKNNFVEVTKAAYDALPAFLKGGIYEDPAGIADDRYFQWNSFGTISQADWDAIPIYDKWTVPPLYGNAPLTTHALGVRYLNPTTGTFLYYKQQRAYVQIVDAYAYWKEALAYSIENLATGVYYVESGGQVKVVAVKNGHTTKANFKSALANPKTPSYRVDVSGKKAKGSKLTAVTRVNDRGFGQAPASYKYYWTDGKKIVARKAAYTVGKSYANKNLWVLSVATFKKYQTVADEWTAAPGNIYGTVGFDVAVTGTFSEGSKVKASIKNAQVSGAKYKYQWLRNGKAIKGATKSSYKIAEADVDKRISVSVTGTQASYKAKTVKSKTTRAS